MKAPLQKRQLHIEHCYHMFCKASTNKYPTTTALRSYLDDLYGARFYLDVSKKGEYHIITFTIEVANEKVLSAIQPLY